MFLNTFQSLDHLVHGTSQKHARAQWLQKYFCKNSTIRKLLYRQHLISTQAKFSHIVYQMVQNYQSVKIGLYMCQWFFHFLPIHMGLRLISRKKKQVTKFSNCVSVCLGGTFYEYTVCTYVHLMLSSWTLLVSFVFFFFFTAVFDGFSSSSLILFTFLVFVVVNIF